MLFRSVLSSDSIAFEEMPLSGVAPVDASAGWARVVTSQKASPDGTFIDITITGLPPSFAPPAEIKSLVDFKQLYDLAGNQLVPTTSDWTWTVQ